MMSAVNARGGCTMRSAVNARNAENKIRKNKGQVKIVRRRPLPQQRPTTEVRSTRLDFQD